MAAVRPPEPDTPYGRLALENLYALFRSLMILGVIVVGVVTNTVKVIDYLITRRGSEPEFGLAAVYTAAVALICLAPRWIHDRNNAAVGGASALLRVEANASKMAALISGGLCLVPAGRGHPRGDVPDLSSSFIIKDIADSIIVLVLCALLVGEPIREVRLEFGRLSGRRADPALDEAVGAAIAAVSRSTPASSTTS